MKTETEIKLTVNPGQADPYGRKVMKLPDGTLYVGTRDCTFCVGPREIVEVWNTAALIAELQKFTAPPVPAPALPQGKVISGALVLDAPPKAPAVEVQVDPAKRKTKTL